MSRRIIGWTRVLPSIALCGLIGTLGCPRAEEKSTTSAPTLTAEDLAAIDNLQPDSTASQVGSELIAIKDGGAQGGGGGGGEGDGDDVGRRVCPAESRGRLHEASKRVDRMTDSEFCSYINQHVFFWGGITSERDERECSNCPAGTHTRAHIQPIKGGRKLNLNGVPVNGYLVAQITNEGAYDEAKYNIPKGATAWIMVEKEGTAVRARVFMRGASGGDPVLLKVTEFVPCNHTETHSWSKARWRKCKDTLNGTRKAADRANEHDSPAWLTCTQGCCVARTLATDGP